MSEQIYVDEVDPKSLADLADTGVAGNAEEYFSTGPSEAFPAGWKFWEEGVFAERHSVADREAYVQLVYRLGSSSNGVFGAAFPRLRIVHLTRGDRVRQAVSWARAAQEGVLVVSEREPARPTGAPVYDAEVIANLEKLIIEGERGWRGSASELAALVHEVIYEDLVDPTGNEPTLRRVLEFLDVDADVSAPRPRTDRQADALNEAWVARYLSDRSIRPAGSRTVGF